MPTYDYQCTSCKHAFEHFQSMKDAVLRTCPKCKKKTLQRLIGTGAALIFKGAGFYQTDYRSESYKAGQKSESSASTPPASDAKPAADASSPAKKDAAPTGANNGETTQGKSGSTESGNRQTRGGESGSGQSRSRSTPRPGGKPTGSKASSGKPVNGKSTAATQASKAKASKRK
jgi:putative FmdB family regulatory protein